MPSLSTKDYQDLLEKIIALETKVHHIEVNVEVNGLYGNNTTLPLPHLSREEKANTQLNGPDSTERKTTSVDNNKQSKDNPPWNHLGAKPKNKSNSSGIGGHGRTDPRGELKPLRLTGLLFIRDRGPLLLLYTGGKKERSQA